MSSVGLIQKIFSRNLLLVKSDAAKWLETLLEAFPDDDPNSILELLAEGIQQHEECPDGVVDAASLDRVYNRLKLSTSDAQGQLEEDELPDDFIRIISAFDMPRLRYNPDKKAFERNVNKATLTGPAEHRANYLRDRFNVIKQNILRSEHFSPPALPGHDRQNYLQLTSIKNLLGRHGQRFLLFGMLSRTEEGQLCLEDLDDKVTLNLEEATPAVGFFPEGSFIMVDGISSPEGVFKVSEIAHPPSEGRLTSRSIFGHMDFLGIGALTLDDEAKYHQMEKKHQGFFIVLSDVHLDQSKVLAGLRSVFTGYEKAGLIPSVIILCGNFSSAPFLFDGVSTISYQNHFTALAQILGSFPNILSKSHLVLVPGPTDPWTSGTLPRGPLPEVITKPLQHLPSVSFASNPCRIRYLSQEIVIFREDIMSKMIRNSIFMKAMNGETVEKIDYSNSASPKKGVLEEFLVQTILDQSHLVPLPLSVVPVLWEFDQSLWLYPMPTTLILADRYSPFELTYELGSSGSEGRCQVFNPGPFSASSGWTTFHVADRRAEQSELPGR